MKTIKDRRLNSRRSIAALGLATLAWTMPHAARATTVRGATTASVVWISAPKSAPKPIEGVLTNQNRSFIPSLIVVPVNSTVRFPNNDAFFHSIYSTSAADPFDIGFYDTGPGKVVTFPNPGIIDVHCHIHGSMHATIIVADGPYEVMTGTSYELDNVPPGKHVLHAWDMQNGERTKQIDVPASGDLTLDVRL
jgi:plastocyanin